MARIRTIKPEFWTDDLLGSISREARLLFIATWNMADDEGLLRWSAPILKGAAFPFDDDLSVKDVQKLMAEIEAVGIVFPYTGGRSQQALAYVVNFHKHQKINRPSPSRLPPPPLGDDKVKAMYAARDGGICHLCRLPLDEKWSEQYENDFMPSPDHIMPRAQGGGDFPSNIKAAHVTCNKGRGDRDIEEYREVLRKGKSAAQQRHPDRFANISVIDSVDDSVSQSVSEREQEQGTGNKDLGEEEDRAFAQFSFAAKRRGWPEPRKLDDDRRKKLRARLAEHGPDGWQKMLDHAEGSEFINNKFPLKIDWVLEPKNFRKVIEGNYAEPAGAVNGHAVLEEDWPGRIKWFRDKGMWNPMWGPKPGETGCTVPKQYMAAA